MAVLPSRLSSKRCRSGLLRMSIRLLVVDASLVASGQWPERLVSLSRKIDRAYRQQRPLSHMVTSLPATATSSSVVHEMQRRIPLHSHRAALEEIGQQGLALRFRQAEFFAAMVGQP